MPRSDNKSFHMKMSRVILLVGIVAVAFVGLTGDMVADDVRLEKTKSCFNCNGTGEVQCPNGKDGLMDCPGPCLKLSKGVWVHLEVAGHPPTDLWQKFYTADGGYQAWNQNHVGDVIQMQNGVPVDTGQCKICGGTGKVKCTICNGTGEITCPICGGKKVIPESWTAFDNPKMKDRPSYFKLKDGRTLIGREVMVIGDAVTIRTQKGDIEVSQKDIVSEEKPSAQK
jgi:hypothetical protein